MKRVSRKVKKHSIAIMAEDARWLTQAAKAEDRSIAKLFKRIVNLWKQGHPVMLSVQTGGPMPLSFEQGAVHAVEAGKRFEAEQMTAERNRQVPPNLSRKPIRRMG